MGHNILGAHARGDPGAVSRVPDMPPPERVPHPGKYDPLTGHEVILFHAVVRKWKRKYASLKAQNDLDEVQCEEDATTYMVAKIVAGRFGALPAP